MPDTTHIFKNIKSLDLKGNPLNYFHEVLKIGNLSTLETLYCIANHIESIQLPYCDSDERLHIFEGLVELNLQENPIANYAQCFNELDKLPSLTHLSVTINDKIGFEETFTIAIGHISQLTALNKKAISPAERRGAEYDIWKRYSVDWVKSHTNNEERSNLLQKCRAYPRLIESMFSFRCFDANCWRSLNTFCLAEYGQPEDIVSTAPKVSNFVTLKLINGNTHQATVKRISRNITVLTLQSLVAKLLGGADFSDKGIQLKYVDNENNIEVAMDNVNKTLEYYSIQNGNSVIVEWK